MNDIIADTNTAIEVLYRDRSLTDIIVSEELCEEYNKVAQLLELDPLHSTIDSSTDFVIPDEYKQINVEQYILNLVPADSDPLVIARVEEELALFNAKNLYSLLQLMIYIVDAMRKENIVWGIGRGSSVASYCLYLLGVHQIDSIKYELDIHEFLK